MEIPPESLPEEVLTRVIEEYVTRGGTDDGQVNTPLDRRVALVRQALARGSAVVTFDPETELCDIRARD